MSHPPQSNAIRRAICSFVSMSAFAQAGASGMTPVSVAPTRVPRGEIMRNLLDAILISIDLMVVMALLWFLAR